MLTTLELVLATLVAGRGADDGFSTAELLGNAALAIIALGLIWAALGDLGQSVVSWIGAQIMGG